MGQAHLEAKEAMMQPGSAFATEEIEILFSCSLARYLPEVDGVPR